MIAEIRPPLLAVVVGSLVFGAPASAYSSELEDAVRAGNLEQVKKLIEQDPALVNARPAGESEGYPPLHSAVYENHFEIAQFLLKNGADVNLYIKNYSSTPILATKNAKMAKLLIRHGADVNVLGHQSHKTPLQEAAEWGNAEVAKVLIDAGAELDFDSAVHLRWTDKVAAMLAKKPWLAKAPRKPLHTAAGHGDIAMVKLLLKNGADPNLDYGISNIPGPYTALTPAVRGGHYEVAELLCEHGADPNVSGGRNHDNLFLYAIEYLDARFVKLMLEHDADVRSESTWNRGATPLHVAVGLGGAPVSQRMGRWGDPTVPDYTDRQSLEKTELLIRHGADVNARMPDGSTPLFFAAIAENQAVCELLMSHGAELDFHSACLLGKDADVERILKADATLAKATSNPLRQSPLHLAARSGNQRTTSLLVSHGANPNAVASAFIYWNAGGFSVPGRGASVGKTPLHIAASRGHTRIVRQLLANGAEVDAKDDAARTALSEAATQGHTTVVHDLLEKGAKVDLGTPLHFAAAGGHADIVRLLLAKGANRALRDDSGRSPLHQANESKEVVGIMLDAGADIDAIIETEEVVERLVKDGWDRKQLDKKTTTLRLATLARKKEVVDLLIARGARIDLLTGCTFGMTEEVTAILEKSPKRLDGAVDGSFGLRPIDLATQHGHLALVKRLLKIGANLDYADTDDQNLSHPLHMAAQQGRRDVVAFLLGQGLEVEFESNSGRTPLHAAANGAQPALVRFLLERGADVNATSKDGSTPLHDLANSFQWPFVKNEEDTEADRSRRRREVAKLLLDAGAEVDAKSDYSHTPLHNAAGSGMTEVAEVLLANGAEINPRTWRNETPLELSMGFWTLFFLSDRDRRPVAELLRQHGGVR